MKQPVPRVAYLINQYPKVSHSFIRREIAAVEACGVSVLRCAIRSCREELVDAADQDEATRTKTVLDEGMGGLLKSFLRNAITAPIRMLKTLKTAIKLGRRSDRGVWRHLIYVAEACVLRDWLQAAEIEHIHAHFGTNSTTVALLCSMLGGLKYSFTIHGPEEFDSIGSLSIVEKVQQAAFVVTVSSFGRSQLYRWCDLSQWNKLHIVHCGVDHAFLTQPPTPIPSELRLVCVGRLCEAKGQLLLIKAIKPLVAEGIPLKLVLVGDGPLRSQIEQLLDRDNLGDFVEITGWASNETVRQELLASRAFVLPSFAEGLPVAIMEALALHRPVISTYVAGIPELVLPGVCGWLVPAGSVADLSTALKSALQLSPSVLEQMGLAGAERVAAQHNIATEAAKLARLFGAQPESTSIEATRPSMTTDPCDAIAIATPVP